MWGGGQPAGTAPRGAAPPCPPAGFSRCSRCEVLFSADISEEISSLGNGHSEIVPRVYLPKLAFWGREWGRQDGPRVWSARSAARRPVLGASPRASLRPVRRVGRSYGPFAAGSCVRAENRPPAPSRPVHGLVAGKTGPAPGRGRRLRTCPFPRDGQWFLHWAQPPHGGLRFSYLSCC